MCWAGGWTSQKIKPLRPNVAKLFKPISKHNIRLHLTLLNASTYIGRLYALQGDL